MIRRLIFVLVFMFLGSLLYYGSIAETWENFFKPWYRFWPMVFLSVYLLGKVFPSTTYWGRQQMIYNNAIKKLEEKQKGK